MEQSLPEVVVIAGAILLYVGGLLWLINEISWEPCLALVPGTLGIMGFFFSRTPENPANAVLASFGLLLGTGILFMVGRRLAVQRQSKRSLDNEAYMRGELIREVKRGLEMRLDKVLEEDIRAALNLDYTPEAVQNRAVEVHDQQTTITRDIDILNIFNEANGTLLIRGKPGAGKSTTLLRLQSELLKLANKDESERVPFLFELPRWDGTPLQEWMAQELERIGTPPEFAVKWVDLTQPMIIPLLDGLDELSSNKRKACVETINAYQHTLGVKLLVCSRSQPEKIDAAEASDEKTDEEQAPEILPRLNAMIDLRPLENRQIQRYLRKMGNTGKKLLNLIEQDETLLELARTPLFLNMMVVTYKDNAALQMLQQDGIAGKNALLAAYVKNRYESKNTLLAGRAKHRAELEKRRLWWRWNYGRDEYWQDYDRDFAEDHLCWLAGQMPDNKLFLIEELQPDVLPDTDSKKHYHRRVRLAVGLAFGLAGMEQSETIREGLIFQWGVELTSFLNISLSDALTGWLAVGLYLFISNSFEAGYRSGSLTFKSDPNQGMRSTWQNARFYGLINGLAVGLAVGLVSGFFDNGGTDLFRHIELRYVLMKEGILPQHWHYASFLEYCCELRLLAGENGGYKFIHRELQAYYAAQNENSESVEEN